jgi:probable HAF family extracellular repeat protein
MLAVFTLTVACLAAAGVARGGIAYTLQDLGTIPGGNGSLALGLNDRGDLVGTSTIERDPRAFLYSNGTMVQLPTPGLAPAWAEGVNDAGLVVGAVGESILSDTRPFVFTTGGGLSLLPIQAAGRPTPGTRSTPTAGASRASAASGC